MNVYPDLTQRQCVRGNSASNIDMAPIMGFDSVGGKETTKMDKNYMTIALREVPCFN